MELKNVFLKIVIPVILCIVIAAGVGFVAFNSSYDDDFQLLTGDFTENNLFFNGEDKSYSISGNCSFSGGKIILKDNATLTFNDNKSGAFNYYGISYKTDGFLKGNVTYVQDGESKSEEFFLKPTETELFSLTDDYLNKKTGKNISSVSFTVLDKDSASLEIKGISAFKRRVEDNVIFSQNNALKIGVSLNRGGGLSHLEDLNSDVQVVSSEGKIKVDSNAAERYETDSVNDKVNLLNSFDTGRLVQQSYYGTWEGGYVGGEFMGEAWNYNPVQGGNKFNDPSKIVDFKISDEGIYVKCRPMDWSKEKEFITPSYMEAWYNLDGEKLNVSCAFTDFSGYEPTTTTQEMPAFYCIEPFNHFYYCDDGEIKCKDDLIFWPDAGYPKFPSSENWVAFTGEFKDSFGIGLYVPEGTEFLAGIYKPGETSNENPCEDEATSYVALVRNLEFKSFTPIEYNYTITTGTVEEIREKFN